MHIKSISNIAACQPKPCKSCPTGLDWKYNQSAQDTHIPVLLANTCINMTQQKSLRKTVGSNARTQINNSKWLSVNVFITWFTNLRIFKTCYNLIVYIKKEINKIEILSKVFEIKAFKSLSKEDQSLSDTGSIQRVSVDRRK